MAIIGIDHVQLAMPRGEEMQARSFYGDVLGLIEIPKPAELLGRGGVWFLCGSVQLHLGVEEEFRPAKKAHPALLVTQFEDSIAAMRDAGFKMTDDTSLPNVRRAFISDPFGNRIELVAVNTVSNNASEE